MSRIGKLQKVVLAAWAAGLIALNLFPPKEFRTDRIVFSEGNSFIAGSDENRHVDHGLLFDQILTLSIVGAIAFVLAKTEA